MSDLFQPRPIHQTASDKFPPFAPVSWSHYVELMRLANPDERAFYELESANQGWDVRTLKRQISACLYERLVLSTDKDRVRQLADRGDMPSTPRQLVKDPLVLEFLGLEQRPAYSERDVESAIIDQLETFLLELSKGFLFEARQKRFTLRYSAACSVGAQMYIPNGGNRRKEHPAMCLCAAMNGGPAFVKNPKSNVAYVSIVNCVR